MFRMQEPFRWNVRRYEPGFVLDVGCGIGRNLKNLDGYGIGVDPNEDSLRVARGRGFTVYTPLEFLQSEYAANERFDSLLVSHVLEHISYEEGLKLLRTYLPFVKKGGKVIIFRPQEAGQASDASHKNFVDINVLLSLGEKLGLKVQKLRSFPVPRFVGRFFKYNEFNCVFFT